MKFAVALLALTLTAGASAQSAPAGAPAPEKKSCRSEATTGSMFPKRTCHTKAEWAEIDETNRRNVDDLSRRSNGGVRGN